MFIFVFAKDKEIEQRIDAKDLLSSTEEQRTELKVHSLLFIEKSTHKPFEANHMGRNGISKTTVFANPT